MKGLRSALVFLFALAAGGCGSGTDGPSSFGGVALRAAWEADRGGETAGFEGGGDVPASVRTVEVRLDTTAGLLRTFVDPGTRRSVEFTGVPAGDVMVEVFGYDASLDGPIDLYSVDVAPSFAGGPVSARVDAGRTTVVPVELLARPFATDFLPFPGESGADPASRVQFVLATAAGEIDPGSVNVSIDGLSQVIDGAVVNGAELIACDDAGEPVCGSGERALRGFEFLAAPGLLSPDREVSVEVGAVDRMDPRRELAYLYRFQTGPGIAPSTSPTATPSPVPEDTPTATSIPVTSTMPATLTPTASATPTGTPENTAAPTVTSTAAGTATPSATATPSITVTVGDTATATPVVTESEIPTATPTSTEVESVTPTATPVNTGTATGAATATGTPVVSSTETPPTAPPSPSSTATAVAPPTETPSPTFGSTATATPVSTPSATGAATFTATVTATPAGPLDGNWSGTSSQGKSIFFVVEDGAMSSIEVDYVVVGGVQGCETNGPLTSRLVPPVLLVEGGFSTTLVAGGGPVSTTVTVAGTLTAEGLGSGTLEVTFARAGAPLCLASASASWTATK